MITSNVIKDKLSQAMGITSLNDMQRATIAAVHSSNGDIVLYSPTGSGKTLAFAIPAVECIDHAIMATQVLIVAPTRELALQISEVARKISSCAVKISCCYGGHNSQDEMRSLLALPHVVIGTPGRLVDHLNRGSLTLDSVKMLVIDEFDKSLELGFADEMSSIAGLLPAYCRKILTSATHIDEMPRFLRLNRPVFLDFNSNVSLEPSSRLRLWKVQVESEDKRLDSLLNLLMSLPDERTIIFSNYRESAQAIFKFLTKCNIATVLYNGAIEQIEREKAVAMFNNGSALVMCATDLASRGLDITGVKHIIHYHVAHSQEVFIHRNGRTARVNEDGDAYIMISPADVEPEFAQGLDKYKVTGLNNRKIPACETIFISAGKKEKISRGDIVGYIASGTSAIAPSLIGKIDIFDHYSLVAVPREMALAIIKDLSPLKLKKRKVKLGIAAPRHF